MYIGNLTFFLLDHITKGFQINFNDNGLILILMSNIQKFNEY